MKVLPSENGTLAEPFEIQRVSDVDLAFPADVKSLLPPWEKIPKEFKGFSSDNPWVDLCEKLFCSGAKRLTFSPKDGVDSHLAMRHLRCILGTYSISHEYKMAAASYLTSLWFDSFEYEPPEEKTK